MVIKIFQVLVVVSTVVLLDGCDFGQVGNDVSEFYELPKPTVWTIKDGRVLNLGDRAGTVVGTDKCNNGFGEEYNCWVFSLIPGDRKEITLTDGTQEVWTTVDVGNGKIYLERPNGFKVSDRLPLDGFNSSPNSANQN